MDIRESQAVSFHCVADKYVIKANESVTCRYAVLPSMTRGMRDLVGIFKIGWKQTQECIVFNWSPACSFEDMDPSLENSCVLFDGAKILTAIQSQCISLGAYYQFCYIDASDQVQGRSKPFRLEFESKSDLSLVSLNNFTLLGGDEDFVEVAEDEDGEIVIIKPRRYFLEEELCRVSNNAKDKELEVVQLRNENDILSLQLTKLQEAYLKVLQEKETMQKLLGELRQSHEGEVSRLLVQNTELSQQLLLKTNDCSRLDSELTRIKHSTSLIMNDLCGSGAAEVVESERTVNINVPPHHAIAVPSTLVHSTENAEPSGACPSDASHCDDGDSPIPDVRQLPRSLPVPFLPDVASVGVRAAVSPCVIAGSPPRVYSSNSGRSPTMQKRPWFGESIFGVGLNIISHLSDMNQFAPDLGDSPEEFMYTARSPPCGQSPDAASGFPYIVRPPVASGKLNSDDGYSKPKVVCQFCQSHIYPTSTVSVQQRLVDHILSVHCFRDFDT